jgi:lipoate-protein ligase B
MIDDRHLGSVSQHPSIYTMGKRGREEHLLGDQQQLARIGAEVFASPRGGEVHLQSCTWLICGIRIEHHTKALRCGRIVLYDGQRVHMHWTITS